MHWSELVIEKVGNGLGSQAENACISPRTNMHFARHFPLLALALLVLGCSDPKCRPGELKVGTVCFEREEAIDASNGSATAPDGTSSRDASAGMSGDLTATARDARSDRDPNAESTDARIHAADGAPEASNAAASPPEFDATAPTGTDAALAAPLATCLTDADKDGFGVEPANAPCPLDLDAAPKSRDCNDNAASAFPGGTETCGDGLDNDCNGKIDDGPREICNGVDDDCNASTPDGAGACGTLQCRDAQCLTACKADNDCVTGLHCVSGACEGTQNGANCEADEQCSSGSCNFEGKCGAKVIVGSACNSPGDCQSGSSCTNGTCKQEPGAPCATDNECASLTCFKTCLTGKGVLNAGCDASSDCAAGLTCQAESCKLSTGQACGADSDCGSSICAGAKCVAIKQDLNGPCDAPTDCAADLSCNGTLCKRNNSITCNADDECISGACLPNGCGTPVLFGAACNSAPDCASGVNCKDLLCRWPLAHACSVDTDCAEGVCGPQGLCRLPAGVFGYCKKQNDCALGLGCYSDLCKIPYGGECPYGCTMNEELGGGSTKCPECFSNACDAPDLQCE